MLSLYMKQRKPGDAAAMNIPDIPHNPITIGSLPREGVPLHNSLDGQVRIVGTRISLEMFLEALAEGAQ